MTPERQTPLTAVKVCSAPLIRQAVSCHVLLYPSNCSRGRTSYRGVRRCPAESCGSMPAEDLEKLAMPAIMGGLPASMLPGCWPCGTEEESCLASPLLCTSTSMRCKNYV